MLTVAETEIFTRLVGNYWNEPERLEFIEHIANHLEAGDVIPGSGGVRKIRWQAKAKGKRGGVRVDLLQHAFSRHSLATAFVRKE